MKKPEEYLEDLFEAPLNLQEGFIEYEFYLAIKQAQIDAIEETCRVCAEEVKIEYIPEEGCATGDYWDVDKQSILSIAEKLKKEL